MALDVDRMNEEFDTPPDLRVEIAEDEAEWWRIAPEHLPYRGEDPSADPHPEREARRKRLFGAWLGDRPVGNMSLLLTRGPLGVGGIYAAGVVPEEQGRGIGAALLRAAARYARERGYQYLTLNAASEWVYRKVGFETLGWGQTWWLRRDRLEAPPPRERIAFVEALGWGETDALGALGLFPLPDSDPDARLLCGITPLQVAVRARQPEAAEWLLEHGATPDLVSAWDLGWKDRLPEFLARHPGLLNRPFGEGRMTPLHEAVMRGDREFARWLLEAGADPTIKDGQYDSSPIGWAEHFGAKEMLRLLEAAA
jgi:GNAT superfamily N-acetyltransferase